MLHECALCELPLPKNPIVEGERSFCCTGCLTVFRILETQELRGSVRGHPLFRQAVEAGVISNPHLLEELAQQPEEEETTKIHFQIEGMWCPACAEAIRLILRRQKGIVACVVDYATDLAVVEYAPRSLSKETIFTKIERLGYHPAPLLSDEKSPRVWIRFAIVAFCALNLMMFAYPLYVPGIKEGYDETFGWLSFALSLPLITYGAWPIWRRFYVALQTALFGMESLVLMGITGAFVYSTYHLLHHDPHRLYFDTMGMVLTFVLLGKLLEKRAKFSAKETLFRITRTLPKWGYKKGEDGSFARTPLKEIAKGDLLLARAGEKIVLDGIVSKGEGAVDESVMTGEAIPLLKQKGSSLLGGSIVSSGALYYTVTSSEEESLLAKITQLIESNLSHHPPLRGLVDRLTRFFVPAVLITALLSGSFLTALSVLLIACPCAIGIAIPLAEALLLHRFAEKGALVRNREALQILASDPLFVFDKTGTLTEGKFRVISGLEPLSDKEKSLLKGLVIHSTHPISVALSEALPVAPAPFQHVQERIGKGLEGAFEGKIYRIGSPAFLGKEAHAATTSVYFEEHLITLGDQVRPNLPKVDGVILSGDSQELVSHLVSHLSFQWGRGECSPQEKQQEIERLKMGKRAVVMVGDGINDAPALTAADVGISTVSATDLSSQASDILLTTEHLDALPELCHLAKRGRRIIYQNLFWAFAYNSIGIAFALTGHLTPLMAAGAMILSSLSVTLNSLRLNKKRRSPLSHRQVEHQQVA